MKISSPYLVLLSIWSFSSFWKIFWGVFYREFGTPACGWEDRKKLDLLVSQYDIMYRCSSLRFHIFNTRMRSHAHNEGNIAVNGDAFSTTGAKQKTNTWKFLLQTFVPFQFFSTFQFQSKPLNLRKNFNLQECKSPKLLFQSPCVVLVWVYRGYVFLNLKKYYLPFLSA